MTATDTPKCARHCWDRSAEHWFKNGVGPSCKYVCTVCCVCGSPASSSPQPETREHECRYDGGCCLRYTWTGRAEACPPHVFVNQPTRLLACGFTYMSAGAITHCMASEFNRDVHLPACQPAADVLQQLAEYKGEIPRGWDEPAADDLPKEEEDDESPVNIAFEKWVHDDHFGVGCDDDRHTNQCVAEAFEGGYQASSESESESSLRKIVEELLRLYDEGAIQLSEIASDSEANANQAAWQRLREELQS